MSAPHPRYAIYFVPERDSHLFQFGSQVLGYDMHAGTRVDHYPALTEAFPDWSAWTSSPSRYGFHATLKAPFRLRSGADEGMLLGEVFAIAKSLPAVSLGPLSLALRDRHLVLQPRLQPAALKVLEAGLVTRLDKLRAPLTDAEWESREPHRLGQQQRDNLRNWGYPFALNEFRFHMTLAGPIETRHQAHALSAIDALYRMGPSDCCITSVTALVQREPGAHFEIIDTVPLGPPVAFGLLNSSFVLSHR